eukprot:8607141-Alexandrium_andersonii.AAC.1
MPSPSTALSFRISFATPGGGTAALALSIGSLSRSRLGRCRSLPSPLLVGHCPLQTHGVGLISLRAR